MEKLTLDSFGEIIEQFLKDMGIDRKSTEWEEVADTLLGMIKDEIMGGDADGK